MLRDRFDAMLGPALVTNLAQRDPPPTIANRGDPPRHNHTHAVRIHPSYEEGISPLAWCEVVCACALS